MALFWTQQSIFRLMPYSTEQELEQSINTVQVELFGRNRIYLNVKKLIGVKGHQRNIPDGYLIDLTGREPRLYLVEAELKSHDLFGHIAVQLLQFSMAYSAEPHTIKQILIGELQKPEYITAKHLCEAHAAAHGYRNIDNMFDTMIRKPFTALLIIDEMPDLLNQVVTKQFNFGVEVIELSRYRGPSGENVYHFEPFLEGLVEDLIPTTPALNAPTELDADEVDTIVVPAQLEGFEKVFLKEHQWHQIRIHGTMRPQIKYIAAYQVRPISAITYVAPVDSIQPWQDTDKFVVIFSEPAQPIGPIKVAEKGRVKPPQNIRYTTLKRLKGAKTLDDVW